jgi:ABC-type Fe3+ transport system permease subunit
VVGTADSDDNVLVVIVALLLLLAVVVVTVAVVQAGGDRVTLDLHWFTVHTNGTVLFIAGACCLLVLVLGLVLLRVGVRRARARHREMRELRQRAFEAAPSTGSGHSPSNTGASTPPRRSPDADDYFDTTPRD